VGAYLGRSGHAGDAVASLPAGPICSMPTKRLEGLGDRAIFTPVRRVGDLTRAGPMHVVSVLKGTGGPALARNAGRAGA